MSFIKKGKYFGILLAFNLLAFPVFSAIQNPALADSVFKAKNYTQAVELYQLLLKANRGNSAAIHLKCAYAYEQMGNIPATLYHLSSYNELKPNSAVVKKMEDLGNDLGLKSYVSTDISTLFQFVKENDIAFVVIFLLLGIYIFVLILTQLLRKKAVKKRHTFLHLVYCSLLLLILNFPFTRQYVIVKKEEANLRNFASGAAMVVKRLPAGEKLKYLGNDDIWNRVFHEQGIFYIRNTDSWLVK